MAKAGEFARKVMSGNRCAIIADETSARLFGDRISESFTAEKFSPHLVRIPAGEKSKSLTQVEKICDELIEAGLDRSSFVVGLGGGVIGDISGFVAAIFQRGIPHVQIPTTLLAMVDSSIGGKTGVNLDAGKNLIGAIHHPALIIADVKALESLPPKELRQGYAEIIKHAIIRDAAMFEMLQSFERNDLSALVRRNIEIKAAIVAADEREISGERALLNFGHTVGHAIERAGDFLDFPHGEAVSLGIVAACEISVRKAGLPEVARERIVSTLRLFDLPTRLPADFPREKILEAIRFDKKFQNREVRFVVTSEIGSARLATDVTMEDIAAAIRVL